ncbi:OPT oligopeptide transporter protein-domain-containing protein [Ilyonectria sp. MPI-CAGE-AT-0026]|nr:OPT oligopeptide transporter protein-domain-containing protein [Ilyonectria sp. MPI-CAGE-AT-0026]
MVLEDVSLEVCFEFISMTSVDMSLKALQFTATEPAKSSLPTVSDARTPRAIACGILLDLTVSLACMYFGLHAGTVNAMPMQSVLLGSAILGAIQHRFPTSQVIAGALGLAPFTSGFTSFLPALEFLTGDEDGPPVRFSLPQLLLWSLAICGPSINASTFLGALLGWGILSPIAKHNGWASGPVGDWENGSRGWILWVGIGLILGDSLVGIAWIVLKLCSSRASYVLRTILPPWLGRSNSAPSEQTPLLADSSDSNHQGGAATSAEDTDNWPDSSTTTSTLILRVAVALFVTYFVCLGTAFGEFISSLATLLAAVLVPLACFVSMRSLGETDNGAALAKNIFSPMSTGRIAQLIASLVVPSSSAQYMPASLLFGGVVKAGASQAVQRMGGLKTAYITHPPPIAVFWGQMVGSSAGDLIATFLHRAYTSVKELPSDEFGIPDGYLYLGTARFLRQ